MKPLFLATAPEPVLPGTDAVLQEIELLRARFGGEWLSVYPWKRPSAWYPRGLYGLHRLGDLRRESRNSDFCHVFFPFLHDFPFVRALRCPVAYSVTAGLSGSGRADAVRAAARAHTVVVSNRRDSALLQSWGVRNFAVIRPGIDASRFAQVEDRRPGAFTLLVGSAPWTRGQFYSKGVHALLEVCRDVKDLRLVFLWRGLFEQELRAAIDRCGVSERVEVIGGKLDVTTVLARVHAAVVLADSPRLVRAYPQSLLESLAAGRPVMVSSSIAMADEVGEENCGVLVDRVQAGSIAQTLAQLRDGYEAYARAARPACERLFPLATFINSYADLYASLVQR